jgi:NADPH:quinone reductase-like Zn-dependent oxidoreductase
MQKTMQLRSKITKDGGLEVSLGEGELQAPEGDRVIVRMEAAPINPSDMGPLFGPANMAEARLENESGRLVLKAEVPMERIPLLASRLDKEMPVGNEGAGVVVEAGPDASAQALFGKTVGVLTGKAYAQYTNAGAENCIVMNEGTTPKQAASCFVNPLTALGMVETMKLEGHSGLVHTAAASNLGQMLNRICINDGVPLVNVVRKAEQEKLLRDQGATHVVDSSKESFLKDLEDALVDTGATLAFDAIGGGRLVSDILFCMERALVRGATGLNTYGSSTLKQAYFYGGLDQSPATLNRNYGMMWAIGGWLLTPFLIRIGAERAAELRQRVADEITTTFESKFVEELSLEEALQPENVQKYVAKKTGEKYLINPNKGM